MSSASEVLKVARSQIGVRESPYGSNKCKYNREYWGDNRGEPWCAILVWWVFKHAGCPELYYGGKRCASVPYLADYYIAREQQVSKNKGEPGDIICFDWNHNNSSDHVGLIEKRNSDGTYTTIEGNTSAGNNGNGGMVMRRKRYKSEISWIFRPKYTNKSSAPKRNPDRLEIDEEWGKATTTASQKVFGTPVDGEVSGQLISCKKYLISVTSSWKFAPYSRRGSELIREIQRFLKKYGYYSGRVDGLAGKQTVMSIQRYLKKWNYYSGRIDGYLGRKTVGAWQRYINHRLNSKRT